ncbi:MAG: GNAT family N-acetyltransferase [Oscillospiraceae bacterium]|nr:GNAT family N-acetyltransferase [Oscillospiraceae bacterium]
MYRKAEAKDREAYCQLWQKVFGDPPRFSGMVFDSFAGEGNVWLWEEGEVRSILSAVPVTLNGKKGAYYYGLATDPICRGKNLMTGLMEYADAALKERGMEFVCLIPASPSLFEFYERRGYEKAFGLRCLRRPIRRNLWAQADFDSVTVKKLAEIRREYQPDSVEFSEERLAQVVTDLYSGGATIVSTPRAYGMFFEKQNELVFIELLAKDDRAAEELLEAAREKTGAEEARIMLGANQEILLGEGKRQDYGMIRFLGEPFDVSESYMRLMMDYEA